MPQPLHPAIVHFPIVLLLIGALCQIAAIWKPAFFQRAALYCFAGGFAGGVVAYMSGDEGKRLAVDSFGAARSMIETHETLAMLTLLAAGVYLAVSAVRFIRPGRIYLPVLLVLSIATAALVTATGHYGGQLVYAKANAVEQAAHPAQHGDDD